MLRRVFLAHPESLGETYPEHARRAAQVGLALLVSGAACLLHALVPAAFPTTASRAIRRLHAELAARAPKTPLSSPDGLDPHPSP